MKTHEEYDAYRDKLAAEAPSIESYKFPTLKELFSFVGKEESDNFLDQVEAALKAEAKLRYMYADAMMEAREND